MMKQSRPPLAERIKQGLRDGIQASRGDRNDLVETRIEIKTAQNEIQVGIHESGERPLPETKTPERSA